MRDAQTEGGFGIAEALVAILLFGIIAVAVVPPIILSLQASASTTVMASASSVVNERIELARQSATSCKDLVAFLRQAIPSTYEDSRGVPFVVTQSPTPAQANGYVISPAGGAGDADGDGVRDTFCFEDPMAAVTFSVDVVSTSGADREEATGTTIIAVPGIGG